MSNDAAAPQPEGELKLFRTFEGQTASFVVRIYVAARRANVPPRWYGTIAHVQSSEQLFFQDVARLISFIAKHSGIPSGLPTRRERLSVWIRRWWTFPR